MAAQEGVECRSVACPGRGDEPGVFVLGDRPSVPICLPVRSARAAPTGQA